MDWFGCDFWPGARFLNYDKIGFDNFRSSLGKLNNFSPLEVTLLYRDEHEFLTRELAKHLSIFTQVNVTVVVPQCDPFSLRLLEEESQLFGYGLVKVEQRCLLTLDGPYLLLFPPSGLKTDIVVGIGIELSASVQLWAKHYQCKSVCVDASRNTLSHNLVEITREVRDLQSETQRLQMLSEAHLVVATGPKMHEKLSRGLRHNQKKVFNFTPGIFIDFCDVCYGDVNTPERKFHVLCFGSDDPNRFEKEGFDIAAKALVQNGKSYCLTYVGAVRNKSQLAEKFRQCGVAETQLDFQSLPKGMEDWKILLSRVDLAIMPSGQKEFGLEALFALSAGLPVLVHADSGFGEALKVVTFGTSAIVDSDDAAEWAEKIRKVRETDKKTRLEQATMLRACYDKKYSWEKQCGELVNMMVKMV